MFYLIYDIILSLKENLQDCGIIVYLPLFEASVRLIFAALWFVRLAAAKYIFIFKYIFQSNISSPKFLIFSKKILTGRLDGQKWNILTLTLPSGSGRFKRKFQIIRFCL